MKRSEQEMNNNEKKSAFKDVCCCQTKHARTHKRVSSIYVEKKINKIVIMKSFQIDSMRTMIEFFIRKIQKKRIFTKWLGYSAIMFIFKVF